VDRPPHTSRRSRVEERPPKGTVPIFVSRFGPALLLALLFLLATSSGCDVLPTPVTAQPPPSGSLVVSFTDVGQGDGVLIQSGGESYLLDAGKAQAGPKVVDFLRSRGVESLDGIVISNPEADHIGGFEDVLDAFEVANVYLSGDPKGTSTYNSFLRAVRDEGSEVVESRAGMQMDWGATRADT
jgi:competence protein ComEC